MTNLRYTTAQDLTAGNFERALTSWLSLTTEEAKTVAGAVGTPLPTLAILWRQWIELCCVSACLRARCSVRFSLPSQINDAEYGSVNHAKVMQLEKEVRATAVVGNPQTRERWARTRVATIYKNDAGDSLVPGKLVGQFVVQILKAIFKGRPVHIAHASADGLVRGMLDTLDLSGDWTKHWSAPILQLLG